MPQLRLMVVTPPGPPQEELAIAACRAGVPGVIELEYAPDAGGSLAALARLRRFTSAPFGVKLSPERETICRALLQSGEARPDWVLLAGGERLGSSSVEGRLRVLSHAALFASCAEPDLVLDPLVIDASTHVLGIWHLAQPDQTGRVLFQYGLGTVRFYGPRPAEGALLKCQVKVESSTDRQVMHRIDIFSAEGPLWCRLYPAQYWRFYWPQPCVRFFRQHDEHLAHEETPEQFVAVVQRYIRAMAGVDETWDEIDACPIEQLAALSK